MTQGRVTYITVNKILRSRSIPVTKMAVSERGDCNYIWKYSKTWIEENWLVKDIRVIMVFKADTRLEMMILDVNEFLFFHFKMLVLLTQFISQ